VGAVSQQQRQGQPWKLLWFFSQKLSAAESHSSMFDHELLAVYSGILHFRHLLEGRHFVIFTEHQLLVLTLSRAAGLRSDRQRRQLSFIAKFTTKICHIASPANVVADTLTWPAASLMQQQRSWPVLHLVSAHRPA
jgi:RNase H-like domain found in reverse transcriptase